MLKLAVATVLVFAALEGSTATHEFTIREKSGDYKEKMTISLPGLRKNMTHWVHMEVSSAKDVKGSCRLEDLSIYLAATCNKEGSAEGWSSITHAQSKEFAGKELKIELGVGTDLLKEIPAAGIGVKIKVEIVEKPARWEPGQEKK